MSESFQAEIRKYGKNKEKTGWTFLEVPLEVSERLNPQHRKSFQVKGWLDEVPVEKVNLLPIGGGEYILVLNAEKRKQLNKQPGDRVRVSLEIDLSPPDTDPDFEQALEESPAAARYFHSLPLSHRKYYIKWFQSAKTEETRLKRITRSILALEREWDYGRMLREEKKARE